VYDGWNEGKACYSVSVAHVITSLESTTDAEIVPRDAFQCKRKIPSRHYYCFHASENSSAYLVSNVETENGAFQLDYAPETEYVQPIDMRKGQECEAA
jgi:hypothetical protein